MALLPAHTDTPKHYKTKTDPKLQQMPTGVRYSDRGFATEIQAEGDKIKAKKGEYCYPYFEKFLALLAEGFVART